MTAAELIRSLRDRGVTVDVAQDRLRVDAPKGVLTDEVRDALVRLKPDVLRHLRAASDQRRREAHDRLCIGCGSFSLAHPGRQCFWCRRHRVLRERRLTHDKTIT